MSSNPPVVPKAAAYKRYLTSLWHIRWLHAAAVALLWHLSVSAVSGDWYNSISSFFWALFPLGPAGFRAALFWITSLMIFMIPLSTFKIGRRCTPSNWINIKTAIANPVTTAAIFLWYAMSAFWFCQVFVYFSPPSQELSWISSHKTYGNPDRLNERPIYLLAFFQVLGFTHAAWHIYDDDSTMPMPTKTSDGQKEHAEDPTTITRLVNRAPAMAQKAVYRSALATVLAVVFYSGLLRRPLWHFTLTLAKAFANVARADATPSGSYYLGGIILKGAFVGFLLSMTWQLDMLLFELYMVTEPLKNALPLSASSKDPNGTLLNGLTRKSDLIRSFAFWELFIISESHPERRKQIFGDIERPGMAPMSALIVNAAIDVVKSIEDRMTNVDPPSDARTKDPALSSSSEVYNLPRLLPNAVPAKNPILLGNNPATSNSGLDRVGSYISNEARVLGSSSNPWSPPLERGKQLAIEFSSPRIKDLQARAENVQQSTLGRYLLTSPVRLIKSVVLGSPVGNAALIIHATKSATNLLVASLKEDTYGRAVASVPPMIQALTRAIFVVEHVIQKHTGGTVTEMDAQELTEVLLVHQYLKESLKGLLEKFGSFLRDVGLSIRDLNEAQKAGEDRKFFQILRPVRSHQPQHRQPAAKREMEDVSNQSQRAQERKGVNDGRSDSSVFRRPSGEKSQAQLVSSERPGRLFSQLDPGSAIDQAWAERRKSREGKNRRR